PGNAPTDEQLAIRLDRIEVDRIRVHDNRAGSMDPHARQSMDRVPAGAAAADDEDPRASEREGIEERLVPGPLRALESHPGSIPTACCADRLHSRARGSARPRHGELTLGPFHGFMEPAADVLPDRIADRVLHGDRVARFDE